MFKSKMMIPEELDLWNLVIEVDGELIQQGFEPYSRPFQACLVIPERLGLHNAMISFDHPLFKAIDEVYRQLYRQADLCVPPMHIGAFMFRDVFFPVRVPIIYGFPTINPVEFLTHDFLPGVPEAQKRWLFSDKQEGLTFFDQVIDLMDFVYGLDDLEKTDQLPEKTIEYWERAKELLEAAAATLLGSFSKFAVTQNCCLATELLLKGTLLAKGTERRGHDLKKIAQEIIQLSPGIDRVTLLSAVSELPNYVESRYEAMKFSRLDLGRFLMNTQFIGGEILRQFSKRNVRSDFCTTSGSNWDLTHRVYPQKTAG